MVINLLLHVLLMSVNMSPNRTDLSHTHFFSRMNIKKKKNQTVNSYYNAQQSHICTSKSYH